MLKVYVNSMSVIVFWNIKVGKDVICNIKEKNKTIHPHTDWNHLIVNIDLGKCTELVSSYFSNKKKKYFFLNQDTALNLT